MIQIIQENKLISGKLNEFMDLKDLKDIVFDFKC